MGTQDRSLTAAGHFESNRARLTLLAALVVLISALTGAGSAFAAPPTVSIDPTAIAGYTTAQVSGTVDPADAETYYSFEYSADPANEGWSGFSFSGPLAAGSGSQPVSGELTGLKPSTTYQVRLVANNFTDPEVISAGPNTTFTTEAVGPPTVTIEPVVITSDSTAELKGIINPEAPAGNPPAFNIEWGFECTPNCPGLNNGAFDADSTDHSVVDTIDGLAPNTTYEVTLKASNAGDSVSAGPVSFTTAAIAPGAQTLYAGTVTSTSAVLAASVNPENSPTIYQFEWGSDTSYGNVVPATPETISPTDEAFHFVTSAISGLAAGSTYHFRIVATNTATGAVSDGADHRFRTLEPLGPPAPIACPNEAVRERQGTTELPECRAYEMVSPVDKNGNEVTGFLGLTAAPTGHRIAYQSTGAFPGSASAPTYSTYLASRSAGGWSTRALSPPQLNHAQTIGGVARNFSTDLTFGISFSELALAPGAVEGAGNIYRQNNLTGELEYIGGSTEFDQSQGASTFFATVTNTFGGFGVGAGDEAFDHVPLATRWDLNGEMPSGIERVYDLTEGHVELVSVLPGGEPAPTDSELGRGESFRLYRGVDEGRPMSADGSRIVFRAGDALYQRVDGQQTIVVSAFDGVDPEPARSTGASFGGASSDGRVIYFVAEKPLIDAAVPDPADVTLERIYRYEDGSLIEVAAVPPPSLGAPSSRVLSVSADGDSVYFQTPLTSSGQGAGARIYRWSEATGLKEIVALGVIDGKPEFSVGSWTMSPDGEFAAFRARSYLTGDAGPSSGCFEEHCLEVYAYSSQTGTVSCPSCPQEGGVASAGDSTLGSLFQLGEALDFSRRLPRGIANDGTVYFDSPTRLSEADHDGKRDIYAWREGRVTLLTLETPADVAYADATLDGRTVYALTVDRLVSQDRDSLRDLYAIEVDGGLTSQNAGQSPPGCQGEGCLGSTPGVPEANRPGSSGFAESGASAASLLRVPARAQFKRATGVLRVRVPGPGSVKANARAVFPARCRAKRAGPCELRLKLKSGKANLLKQGKRIVVHLDVTYKPTDGSAEHATVITEFSKGGTR